MRMGEPTAYSSRPGSMSCGGARGGYSGGWSVRGPFWPCAKIRLVTGGSSMQAIIFSFPAHASQASISILRVRLRRFKIAPGDFVERLEHHVRSAIPIERFQSIMEEALGRQ